MHSRNYVMNVFVCSSEYKQKYDEIVKQNGILTIDSRVSLFRFSSLSQRKISVGDKKKY